MNIFYAPPSQIRGELITLTGQEAIHASKALRYSVGDAITVVDGQGGWHEGKVQLIGEETVRIISRNGRAKKREQPEIILGMGIIKKRDRLEFAVEKAVELGAKEIALFRSAHTIKKNVRIDRLESIARSAMKQSLRAWLPQIRVFASVTEVAEAYPESRLFVAHESERRLLDAAAIPSEKSTLLLVGPEGGFSPQEITNFREKGAAVVSLGANRLRTETAAITLINQYNYSRRRSPKRS